MLTITEDERFYFDTEAADRVVRFIEKFLRHYEGEYVGKPFILHALQKKIVRDLFGWKWKSGPMEGLRRFTECYFEGAVGCGKSPLLAALALYMLMADGEAGAQIYCFAKTYTQAKVVFDTAKKFIEMNDELARRLRVTQYEIRHPRSKSFFRIVAKKGPGAGARPHMAVGDEVHNWETPAAYNDLKQRMGKKQRPMMLTATNAGESRASFCWQLREKAVKALEGRGDLRLYPIIWAADESDSTKDPAAWRKANPLIGVTMSESKIKQECDEAVKTTEDESDFRRTHLGIWPKTAGGRWLDLNLWDKCAKNFNASDHEGEPLYASLDLSQVDDLCAATYTWVTPDRFYVGCDFWLPKKTAQYYYDKEGLPYLQWAEDGFITLVNEDTITPEVRKRIAQRIIDKKAKHKIKLVGYDRYKADEAIIALEAAGILCMPIPQGYSVSPGCNELERRIKEESIQIVENPVMRYCAENATTKGDDRGNIWVVKPNAKEKYAGKRGAKIDGITALVTALSEARKHAFPTGKQSKSKAYVI